MSFWQYVAEQERIKEEMTDEECLKDVTMYEGDTVDFFMIIDGIGKIRCYAFSDNPLVIFGDTVEVWIDNDKDLVEMV